MRANEGCCACSYATCLAGNCALQSATWVTTAAVHFEFSRNITMRNVTIEHGGGCALALSLCFTSSYGRDTTGKSSAFRLSQRALHLCAHTDGLWFGPGVRDASFVGGRVLDLAAGGVRVGEGVGYLQEANMPRNSQTCCPRSDHSTALPLTGCSVVSRPRTGRCSM